MLGYKSLSVWLLLCTLATPAMSLPDDRNQPINIESNRVHLDDKTGVTIYEGAVVITQGSIKINADKVVISNRGEKVSKLVCIGKPAVYRQLPSASDGLVTAKGKRIEYYIAKDMVLLLQDASLEQDGGVITGERIEYDLKQEIVNAKGSQSGQQRIQMVIPPQQLQTEDDETTDPEPVTSETTDTQQDSKDNP